MAAAGCLVLGASLLALRVPEDAAAGDARARDAGPAADAASARLSMVVAPGVAEAELRFPATTVATLYPALPAPIEVEVEAMAAAPVVTHTYGAEQWRELAAPIFGANIDRLLNVMRCESNGDPWATGGEGEMGLLQVHPRWHPDATYDPFGNLMAAARISDYGRTFAAWDGPTPGRGEREAAGGPCGY